MDSEKQMLNSFIDYLIKLGFPKESIALGYRFSGPYLVDIVIVDQFTNLPIMLFELNNHNKHESVESGKRLLKRIGASLGKARVPMYLVSKGKNIGEFEIYEIDPDTGVIISSGSNLHIFNYEYHRIARLSETANKKKVEKKNTIDHFMIASWFLAILLALVLIGTKIYKFEINATDLVLIGGIVGLVLIPFASKIKFLGIEFERLIQAKEK